MIWIVIDNDRWGYSHNVVRADSGEQAAKLAGAKWPSKFVEVIPIPENGSPGVIWCHDESPSTGD